MADYYKTKSEDDFLKARNKAMFNSLQNFLNPEETELLSFTDVKKWLKPDNEVYVGMKAIPISLIAGSEGRYKDFDNHFFPKSSHLKHRWQRIDQAHITNVILPPIKLYEIAGLYFVRDGNHRVSVARSKGVEFIDAEVISLKSKIKLHPGMTKRQILRRIISYEKKVFYTKTSYGDITEDWDLDFSTTGQYDVIWNHIQIHKYYINQNRTYEIEMEEAILSWYNNVYRPVVRVLQKQKIMRKFRNRTFSDMYVWLIRYWDDLKQHVSDDYSLDTAATQFSYLYGKSFWKRLWKKLFRKNEKET
ncbi:MAG TPA: transcriptional regulator [Treponemataceae bacterium]|nr:transcriptional regulator [Treponemataceae bacterium]